MPSLPPPRPRPRSFGGSGSFAPTLGRAPRPGSRSSHHKRPWRDTQSSGRGGAFAPTPSRGLCPWSTASSPSGPTTLCCSGASAAGVQGAAPPDLRIARGAVARGPPCSSSSARVDMSCHAILPARGLAFLDVGQHKIHGLISEGKAINASILCPAQDLLLCSARRTTPSTPASSAAPSLLTTFLQIEKSTNKIYSQSNQERRGRRGLLQGAHSSCQALQGQKVQARMVRSTRGCTSFVYQTKPVACCLGRSKPVSKS